MLNKRAKHYGTDETEAFKKQFLSVAEEEWLTFDPEYFGLKSAKAAGLEGGVNQDTIRLLEMMASLTRDKALGSKFQAKLTRAYERLFSHAATRGTDTNSPYQTFFVASKALADPQSIDNTMINFHALSGLIEARKSIGIEKIGMSDKDFSLYRNYFFQKLNTNKVATAFYALRSLKNL